MKSNNNIIIWSLETMLLLSVACCNCSWNPINMIDPDGRDEEQRQLGIAKAQADFVLHKE